MATSSKTTATSNSSKSSSILAFNSSCLKSRIHEINSVGPINGIVHQPNAFPADLQDQHSLRDSEMLENFEVEVCLRSSPMVSTTAPGMTTLPPQPSTTTTTTTTATVTVATSGSSKNKLKVMVQLKFGNSKIPMEVNPTDNVGKLKKELQKLQ
ncbi:hypothetical protein SDJN03_12996, partial [Cucurbita argyrosperma subsp. sororia]